MKTATLLISDTIEANNSYLYMSADELRKEAATCENYHQTEKAADYDWHFDPAFRTQKISEGPKAYAKWMKKEIDGCNENETKILYNHMLENPTERPIVIHLDINGIGHIWEGEHRMGAATMREFENIPAIVGVKKKIRVV